MNQPSDKIFAEKQALKPFCFDSRVATVFPDMIKRSVPGYLDVVELIGSLAERFIQAGTNAYDLGCSLGESTLAMSRLIDKRDVNIIAIDNSAAMIEKCRELIGSYKHNCHVSFEQNDIQNISITNASMAVLNYTLQFINPTERNTVIRQIYEGTNPGGLLILSEKVIFADKNTDHLLVDLHHNFKRKNGYSDLEISQKRNALENVLVPEALETHLQRLKDCGYSEVNCIMQNLNFVTIMAIK